MSKSFKADLFKSFSKSILITLAWLVPSFGISLLVAAGAQWAMTENPWSWIGYAPAVIVITGMAGVLVFLFVDLYSSYKLDWEYKNKYEK